MKIVFASSAWSDYVAWQALDRTVVDRINTLVKEVTRAPVTGLGKPEPLKGDLAGWWSRRITGEHRLVYRVRGSGSDQVVEIAACRYHY